MLFHPDLQLAQGYNWLSFHGRFRSIRLTCIACSMIVAFFVANWILRLLSILPFLEFADIKYVWWKNFCVSSCLLPSYQKNKKKLFFWILESPENSAQGHKVGNKLCNNSQNIPWDLKGILNLYYICKCVKKVVINLSSLKIDSPSTLSKAYLLG